ncbi:helix-turn-helix transcriptional regulator [Beduini massiliensis]|uniref:helix-turn-helix transcriptional regulator n=1 Tax=Beduini massiliensis TaxID=1585974 RepID=UPI00059A7C3A|nr:AraC family transcriptional regulator [Beduini massiliensis]
MQPSIELLKEILVPYERLPLRIFYFQGKKSAIGYPLHTHRDAELLFCVHGSLDIRIKETIFHLKKEDYLYINLEEAHATICPVENEILVLQISNDFIRNISNDPNFRIENETMLEKEKKITEPERVKTLLFQIYSHYALKEEGYHLKIYSLLFEVAYLFVREFKEIHHASIEISTLKHQTLIQDICLYIKNHYNEPLTLNELSLQFAYTPQYIASLFQNYIGMTFLTYLNSIRIDKSLPLLINSDLSIIQISEACGFASVKSFNKVFKAIYQLSPNKFRHFNKRHQIKN